ncbi:MAG TPA: Gfo/Idh/MocA family oxidoreductase, partial [Puia sp.]|nr:Gfo/Idh/MocA family oxidoreductase [Puia sp.]
MTSELRIGILGAGGFAAFAANAFSEISGVAIHSVFDVYRPAAERLAAGLHAAVPENIDAFLADSRLDLVYIATPPFLHYEQSRLALLAGKHVICEKPAALRTAEAEELRSISRANRLLWVVNLMQRYNPLYATVKQITDNQLMGAFLHGFFENYASDENLAASHWFWDAVKSGGIFIEHGVHFFDMFAGWLGEGRLASSLQLRRPGISSGIIDRVHAVVVYKDSPVQFYHGFDQPALLDRQECRLLFERGDIRLDGWVPVRLTAHGLLGNNELRVLRDLLPGASVHATVAKSSGHKPRGRFKDIDYDEEVTIEYGNIGDKQPRYRDIL